MKRIFTLLNFLLCAIFSIAKPVDPVKARAIGQSFLSTQSPAAFNKTMSLNLAYTATGLAGSNNQTQGKSAGGEYFYVFNINGSSGFVIIAADDQVIPVLGYSNTRSFDPSHIPANVSNWLEGYKKEIHHVVSNNIPATPQIAEQWSALNNGTLQLAKKAGVGPLLTTKWDQAPYYNDLCPFDTEEEERTVTGCVATAMAQIMKFWNYPKTGTGFHSYNHDLYGTLAASFSSTTYAWSSMPDEVSSSNTAVATLMYHCGVSVDMNYGIASVGGSGAYVIEDASATEHCSEYALKNYFGYKPTLHGEMREEYTDAQWMNMVNDELEAGRPILYAGFGDGGGHAFVCDGYDNNNFMHFNWGWGGYYDGFFALNALNPGGLGTGGGSGGFNNHHQAIFGLEPPVSNTSFDLEISNDVYTSSNTITYGDAFYVYASIENAGTENFIGDLTVAIFDQNNLLISYTDTLKNYSVPAGSSAYPQFYRPSTFTILPGSYTVSVFYKTAGSNWKKIQRQQPWIEDNANIVVAYSNYIEAYDIPITPEPGTLVKGASATVTYNVANQSPQTFHGYYLVGLFNLDGTLAQTIGMLDAMAGLPANTYYNEPIVTTADTIKVEPGTYLMAIMFHPDGASSWYLAGSTYQQNPIKVNVVLPPLPADQYESNDTILTAYKFTPTFNGDTALITTEGSNCHTGVDYDYYKVELPAGYNYAIRARVHDSQKSGNGEIYTLDALVSYAVTNTSLSEAFDDIIPDTIKQSGVGTVYFKISPNFTGSTGTYLLDFKIIRTPAEITSIKPLNGASVAVYPNPAQNQVFVDLGENQAEKTEILLMDMQGKLITRNLVSSKQSSINTSALENGIYFIKIVTEAGTLNRKLILSK